MEKTAIKKELVKFRHLTIVAREAGLTDAEIVDALGLKPHELGETTRQVLRAIQQGTPAEAHALAEVVHGDRKKYRSIHYHLNKLAEAGYLYEQKAR